jgi:hypothetical protein
MRPSIGGGRNWILTPVFFRREGVGVGVGGAVGEGIEVGEIAGATDGIGDASGVDDGDGVAVSCAIAETVSRRRKPKITNWIGRVRAFSNFPEECK